MLLCFCHTIVSLFPSYVLVYYSVFSDHWDICFTWGAIFYCSPLSLNGLSSDDFNCALYFDESQISVSLAHIAIQLWHIVAVLRYLKLMSEIISHSFWSYFSSIFLWFLCASVIWRCLESSFFPIIILYAALPGLRYVIIYQILPFSSIFSLWLLPSFIVSLLSGCFCKPK